MDMEDKNISSKFTSHTQTKYKNTKMQTCLQGLLPWDMSFQSLIRKYIPPKCYTLAASNKGDINCNS